MTSKQIYQEILGIDVLKKIKQSFDTESELGESGGRGNLLREDDV